MPFPSTDGASYVRLPPRLPRRRRRRCRRPRPPEACRARCRVITVRDRAELIPKAFAGRPVIISSANGHRSKDAERQNRDPGRVRHDRQGRRSARRGRRRRPDRRARPNGPVGRPGRPAQRRGRRSARRERACMGPTKRAGSVASLEDIATPAAVAKAVMDYTDHIMLVGRGRQEVRARDGLQGRRTCSPKRAAQDWLRWKARLNPNDNWLDLRRRARRRPRVGRATTTIATLARLYDARGVPHTYGTINMNAVTADGRHRLGHDDERTVVEDPGPRRRLADHRRRPVLRQRRRRGRIDRARRSEHQGVRRLPRRGVHAPGHVAGAGAHQGDGARHRHDRKAAARRQGPAVLRAQLLRREQEGRVRRRRAPTRARLRGVRRQGCARREGGYLFEADQRPKGRPISGTLVKP